MTADPLPLLEKIQAIAKTGLHYSKDPYDAERYRQLLELASEYYGRLLEAPPQAVREQLLKDLGAVTPKVGSGAAVFDAEGRILLMLRRDNRRWCMPCGLVEVGETPEQCAVREAKEETGLEVRPLELVGVFTRFPMKEYTAFTLVSTVYLCEAVGGELRGSHEDLGLAYWELDEVPVWHGHQEEQARLAHALWRKRRAG